MFAMESCDDILYKYCVCDTTNTNSKYFCKELYCCPKLFYKALSAYTPITTQSLGKQKQQVFVKGWWSSKVSVHNKMLCPTQLDYSTITLHLYFVFHITQTKTCREQNETPEQDQRLNGRKPDKQVWHIDRLATTLFYVKQRTRNEPHRLFLLETLHPKGFRDFSEIINTCNI